MLKEENIYKFETDDGLFVYIIADSYDVAKTKIKSELSDKNYKFKYCQVGNEKVTKLKNTLGKGDELCLNMKSIVIY